MSLEETFALYVRAYHGILEMDQYSLKEYVLYDLKLFIEDFIKNNPLNINYEKKVEEILKNSTWKEELQDALLVLPKINASLELILMVKATIRELNEKDL